MNTYTHKFDIKITVIYWYSLKVSSIPIYYDPIFRGGMTSAAGRMPKSMRKLQSSIFSERAPEALDVSTVGTVCCCGQFAS